MFKKLRWKFMWLSTAILFAIISMVVGIMYYIASNTILLQTRILMEEIYENNGAIPGQWEFDSSQKPYLALGPESLYETRYYIATVGDAINISHMHIALKEAEAEKIAERIYKKRGDYGSIHISGGRTLNYLKKSTSEGTFMVILDSTSHYNFIRIITIYLSALWSAVLILYIILMGRYSGKLVRPFIENDEKQKRFITNASHELKTPLTVISSNTEMMEAMGGKSKWTESTRRQVVKLQNLIEDLVVLSRLDEMKDAVLTRALLSEITLETAESFRGVAEEKGITFTVDITDNVYAKTEERSYRQLVSILVDNAVKYCDKNGKTDVRLIPRGRGRGCVLTVSNTYEEGKNIEDYSRFFERFYREDASHNSARAGFGIGLSMAKEISERLGGSLRVSYSEDTISFELNL